MGLFAGREWALVEKCLSVFNYLFSPRRGGHGVSSVLLSVKKRDFTISGMQKSLTPLCVVVV